MPELQSSWDMESEIKDMKTCHFIKKKKKQNLFCSDFTKAEAVYHVALCHSAAKMGN